MGPRSPRDPLLLDDGPRESPPKRNYELGNWEKSAKGEGVSEENWKTEEMKVVGVQSGVVVKEKEGWKWL